MVTAMAEARQARRRAAAPRPPPPRRQPLVIPAASTLLIAAVLLIAAASGGGPRGAAAELHDDPSSAQRRYKILTLVAIGDTSHSFDLLTVAGRLAKRHDVTVASPVLSLPHTTAHIARLGDYAGPMRVQGVDVLLPMMGLVMETGGMPGKLTFVEMVKKFTVMPSALAKRCRRLLANETLMAEWRTYDALLTVPFPPPSDDTCACLVAHALGLPLLHVRDMTLNAAPHDVPQMGSGLTRDEVRGSWRGYLRNLAFYAVQRAFNLVLGRYERAAFAPLRRELGLPLSHYTRSDGSGLTCEPWVEAVSANWLFEEPQPLAPPQVMVGAISPHPARPAIADADVAGFAAAAEASGHGLALVSFGSISAVFGSVLNTEDYEQLALGFADLAPVRVLWLLKPDAVPGGAAGLAALPLGNNTLVKPWGHINDILGHRATRVFVSHGGQKSVLEAMFHGVPVVGVPFMVEQAMNSGRAAARGFGVVSPEAAALRAPGQRFTRASVAGLVRTVLEPRYAQAAHAVGEAMRAAYAMRAPADRAAEEIELALLHGGYRVEAAVRAAAARRARRQQQQQQQQEEEAGGAAPAPVTEASQQRGRAAAAAAAAAEADVGGAKAAGVAAAGHSEL